jgi:hypothetical protein
MTRRTVLRGGAVALSLPWLETLAARPANATGTAPLRRYLSMYFPNGSADQWWTGGTQGTGGAWQISPILEPLLPSRPYLLVLNNVGNYSVTNGPANPSHGTLCAGAWHCFDPRKGTAAAIGGGISVDQVIANQIGSLTPLPSLQVGLSTLDSFCDGVPCGHSRSMSWTAPNMPLYKMVNPQAVFDRLVTAGAPPAGQSKMPMPNSNMPDPKLAQIRAQKKSVLDAVLDSATTLRSRVSTSDRARIDQYLTSVSDLEKLVTSPAMQVSGGGPTSTCTGMPRPPEAYADMNTPPDYSREKHANLMIQLVALAFACDLTRTVSFMLDDSRSDYVYSHVPMRLFNTPAPGTLSSPGTGTCAGYHGLQHAGNANDGFATIIWWMASKANQMTQALAAITEGAGTVMDSTVIHFGSGMHGGNHGGLNLPIVLIGSGGGVLKQNANLMLMGDGPAEGDAGAGAGSARLANLHLTLMQKVFGCSVASFGVAGASTGILPDILA